MRAKGRVDQLAAERRGELDDWWPGFLKAIEREVANGLDLLFEMEGTWFHAQPSIAGRGKDSHVTSAVDLLAVAPVLSATTLAGILGIAMNDATRLPDEMRLPESRSRSCIVPNGGWRPSVGSSTVPYSKWPMTHLAAVVRRACPVLASGEPDVSPESSGVRLLRDPTSLLGMY
jgi:hypothetical protein